MRQACEDIQIFKVRTFMTHPPPPHSFNLCLSHLPLHPASGTMGRATIEVLCVIIHTWPWPWCFERWVEEEERNALRMVNVKMLNWHIAEALLLFPLPYPHDAHTHANSTPSFIDRYLDSMRYFAPFPAVPNFPLYNKARNWASRLWLGGW